MYMRFGAFSSVSLFSMRFEYMTFTRSVSLKSEFCIGPFACLKAMSSSSLVHGSLDRANNPVGAPRPTSTTIWHHHPPTGQRFGLVCIVDVFTPSSMVAFHVAKPFTPLKVYYNIVSRCSFPTMRQNRCHHA